MNEPFAADLVRSAQNEGRDALSEHDSKKILSAYGIPVTREGLAREEQEAVSIAGELGYPVALKACSSELLHKSEQGAVLLHLGDAESVRRGFARILESTAGPVDGVLVQEMIPGNRELVMGLTRDPQFGPCVMFGLGGVLTEALQDTAFRVAPFDAREAEDMCLEIRAAALLGAFRGQAPADLQTLCNALVALGRMGLELTAVDAVDANPVIVTPRGGVVAADALVVLQKRGPSPC